MTRRQTRKRAEQIHLKRARSGFPPVGPLKLKRDGTVEPRVVLIGTPYRHTAAFAGEFKSLPPIDQEKTISRLSQIWRSVKRFFYRRCDVCGGPWNPKTDGIIGNGKPKVGFENYTGASIEKIWIGMGYNGYRVCSECFYKWTFTISFYSLVLPYC